MDRPRSADLRIPRLDGVRGMAIALVMIFHLLKFVGDHPAATLLQGVTNAGSVGVDLFFVLSGLLITGELLQTKGRPRYFRNFYARRWRRP